MIVPKFGVKLSKYVRILDADLASISVFNRHTCPVVLIGLSESNHAKINALENDKSHAYCFPNRMRGGKQKSAPDIRGPSTRHSTLLCEVCGSILPDDVCM